MDQHVDAVLPEPRHSPPADDLYVVAIGGSAGGLKAIQALLARLPKDFPAAILVVMHLTARRPSALAEILDAAGPLRAAFARDGEAIAAGRVYVAPPDLHLLLRDGKLILRRGPIENCARPAVDPLFRSLASERGSRAIAIVVSGNLSDGAAGLIAVKRCGGTTIAQDPEEAQARGMPHNAIATGAVGHVAPVAKIADLLLELTSRPAPASPPVPGDIALEARIAAGQAIGVGVPEQLGTRSVLSCPECQGALWEIREGDLKRYRCHTGHAYSRDALEEAQVSELDRALGSALRIIDERVYVVQGLATDAHERQRPQMARQWERRIEEYHDQARVIRDVLMAKKNGDSPGEAT